MGYAIGKVITTFLAISLMTVPALFPLAETDAEEGRPLIRYVSLGDSMVNGYGMPEYYANDEYNSYGFEVKSDVIYPTRVAKYLESKGYDVEYNQLAVSSTRTLDLRSLIYDEFGGDDITQSQVYAQYMVNSAKLLPDGYTPDMDGFKNYYKDKISAADLITYQFHYDFSKTMQDVILNMGNPILHEPFATVDPFLYILSKSILDSMGLTASAMDRAFGATLGTDKITKLIESFAKGISFCLTMYCRDFDYNMARILELNPDATIIVVDTTDPIREMNVDVGPLNIPIGELYGMMGNFGNFYTKYLSPYAGCAYHVGLDSRPELLLNEITNVDLSDPRITIGPRNDVTMALLKENVEIVPEELRTYVEKKYSGHIPTESYRVYDYFDGDDYDLTEFMKYALASNRGDLVAMLGKDGVTGSAEKAKMKLVNNLDMFHDYDCDIVLHDDGGCTVSNGTDSIHFDYNEMFMIYIANSMLAAALIHFSPAGHEQIASSIISAMEQQEMLNGPPRHISPLFITIIVIIAAIGSLALYRNLFPGKSKEE